MSAGAAVGDVPATARGGATTAPGRVVALWFAAALISGFTARRYVGPLDEGVLMQAATRMAAGEWPWRDFSWAYGPGQPLVVMALGKAFEPSLLWWRLLRVAADASAAVLVYALVRDRRSSRWALGAWAAAAVTAAQPTSANPTAPALAFALGAVLLATRGRAGWAGAAAAAAAFWRPDLGVIAALAGAATLLVAARGDAAAGGADGEGAGGAVASGEGAGAGGDEGAGGGAGAGGDEGAGGGAGAGGDEGAGGGAGAGGDEGAGSAAGAGAAAGGGEGAGAGGDEGAGGGAGEGRGAGADGAAVAGGGDAAGRGEAWHAAARCLLAAAGAAAALYAPFLVAAGPGTVWTALAVDATRDGAWWRLPFPPGFGGGDVKDFLTWLAPYAALLTLALGARKRTIGLFVLGAGATIYYVSRADLEHAQGLLIVAAALAALINPKPFGIAVLALLLAVGAANRASALLKPPDLRPFAGVQVPPGEAAALAALTREVQRLVPPGEPIYVAPRRSDLVTFSNPLLHYLTDRPNVLHRDVLLQAKPDEQANIVRALRRAQPKAIVRWTAPESARPEPNARGRPSGSTTLDDYLTASYRRTARFGDYDVLVPRQ